MITGVEYENITGEAAPEDFAACEALACEMIHGHTLYAYAGRTLSGFPQAVQSKLKTAVALQTLAILQGGGIAGVAEDQATGMSLGRYSYSGLGKAGRAVPLSPAADALIPFLTGYGRGLNKEGGA